VADGAEDWRGPADFSGNLFCGYTDKAICFAVVLEDDSPNGAEDGLIDIYLRTGAAGAATATALPHVVRVSVSPDGRYRLRGCPDDAGTGVGVRVTSRPGGYCAEVSVPLDYLPSGQLPETIRFEVVLTDLDPGDSGPTRLVFSGKTADQLCRKTDMFAVFKVADESSP
jgi:hypothetical protein